MYLDTLNRKERAMEELTEDEIVELRGNQVGDCYKSEEETEDAD